MSAAPSRGLVALYKRGWNEIPDIMAGSFMGLIGIGLTIMGVYNYYAKDGDNRRYRTKYTVIRDDDPFAARVKRS